MYTLFINVSVEDDTVGSAPRDKTACGADDDVARLDLARPLPDVCCGCYTFTQTPPTKCCSYSTQQHHHSLVDGK